MKAYNSNFLDDLRADLQTIAVFVRVTVPNRDPLLLVDHDRDIEIQTTDATLVAVRSSLDLTGVYRSRTGFRSSDIKTGTALTVDNVDVEGATAEVDEVVPGITVADMESGLLDHAPVILFCARWDAPDRWQQVLRYGNLGEFRRDSNGAFQTEIRGLMQLLQQNVGDLFSDRCIVRHFGDSRCKFDVDSVVRTGVIASVTSRKVFTVTLTPGTDPDWADFFDGAQLTFTSGDNQDYTRETLAAPVSAGVATVTLWDELPADAQVGDALTIRPDCTRLPARCKQYNNFVNFQGYGLFMLGAKALMRGPTGAQQAEEGNPSPPSIPVFTS